jgi:hypothetical protein
VVAVCVGDKKGVNLIQVFLHLRESHAAVDHDAADPDRVAGTDPDAITL